MSTLTPRIEKKANGFVITIEEASHPISVVIDCSNINPRVQKYELTNDAKMIPNGAIVYRIRALRDIPEIGIRARDYGGWVQSDRNLSQEGACWIGEDAIVYGEAQVYGNAQVYGCARVYGHAQVFGCARVYGNALIYERAKIYGDAMAYGKLMCFDDVHIYTGRHNL